MNASAEVVTKAVGINREFTKTGKNEVKCNFPCRDGFGGFDYLTSVLNDGGEVERVCIANGAPVRMGEIKMDSKVPVEDACICAWALRDIEKRKGKEKEVRELG